jgi:hypothetical protein
MEDLQSSVKVPSESDLQAWCDAINKAIKKFSDKDWNYSRISLVIKRLNEINAPYVLHIEWLDIKGKKGAAEYKESVGEVTWGQRHTHELGMLEIASLRLNQALNMVTSSEYWHNIRPVIRLQKKEEISRRLQTHAFWYQIEEVQGEEFENR